MFHDFAPFSAEPGIRARHWRDTVLCGLVIVVSTAATASTAALMIVRALLLKPAGKQHIIDAIKQGVAVAGDCGVRGQIELCTRRTKHRRIGVDGAEDGGVRRIHPVECGRGVVNRKLGRHRAALLRA